MRIFEETRWIFIGVLAALLSGVGAYYYHNQDEIKDVPKGPELVKFLQKTLTSAEVAFVSAKTKVMDVIDSAQEPQVVSVDPRVKKSPVDPVEAEEPVGNPKAQALASSTDNKAEGPKVAPAVEAVEKVEIAKPAPPKDNFTHAVELNKQGKFGEAIQFLEKSKDKASTDQLKKEYFVAYTGLGTKFRKKGDCESAIGYFKKAFSTNLTDPTSPLNLAGCYIAEKRSEEAELMIKEALNLSDDKAKVYFALGQSYSKHNLTGKAMQAYDKALEIDPNHWESVYGQGHELFTQGKVDEGIELLKAAEKISTKPDDVYWSLSMAYCKKKNGKEARAYYLKLLKTKHPKINIVANYLGKHCANNSEEPLAMNAVKESPQ